ncbi:MAG: hypothetical protein PHI32_04500 [Dysgonamonadaceae bacterium]|nr:hypothetical protein [Dysgonamonadaceae bacterium]MDD4727715.1 hypothetical protein [Dysgonamonadaceae bacterium]
MNTKDRSITVEKETAQNNYSKPLKVHADECHKLMTNPRNKGDELSETTKSWLREKAVDEVLGLRNIVITKPILKGIVCEHNSIDLYNKVMRSDYKKNDVTKERYGFRGTPDLLGSDCIIEIKTSWDATTFPFFQDEVSKVIKKGGYDWQCRVYMMLFDINKAFVSYCLVDTPTEKPNGEQLLNEWDNFILHRFDGVVDAQKRVSTSDVIERDASIEQQMREQYVVANRYYQNYLDELYKK